MHPKLQYTVVIYILILLFTLYEEFPNFADIAVGKVNFCLYPLRVFWLYLRIKLT